MSKTIVDVATQIAEAVMDAIERRNGIIKDDITEAARGVLAKNQSGSNPYLPHMGLMESAPMRPGTTVLMTNQTRLDANGLYRAVLSKDELDAMLRPYHSDDGKIWSLPNGSP